jgi:hypothetical protein
LSSDLYDDIKKLIKFDSRKSKEDIAKFQNNLPYSLRMKLAMEIHREIH